MIGEASVLTANSSENIYIGSLDSGIYFIRTEDFYGGLYMLKLVKH